MISSDDARNTPDDVSIPALDEPVDERPIGWLTPDVQLRADCFELAKRVAPASASIYDLVAMADWLERGPEAIHDDEPPECSCNNPEATHPVGDSAFCAVSLS